MSDNPDASRIPLMPPYKAREIARALERLAHYYAEAGMSIDATRAERNSNWWLTYATSLAQTPPPAVAMSDNPEPGTLRHVADAIAALSAKIGPDRTELVKFGTDVMAAFDRLQADLDAIKDVIRRHKEP